jgi:hypothetical protein
MPTQTTGCRHRRELLLGRRHALKKDGSDTKVAMATERVSSDTGTPHSCSVSCCGPSKVGAFSM